MKQEALHCLITMQNTMSLQKTGSERRCSGRVGSSCSTSDTCRVVTSCYKPGEKSWMGKGRDCDYDKRNIFDVICDTDIYNTP